MLINLASTFSGVNLLSLNKLTETIVFFVYVFTSSPRLTANSRAPGPRGLYIQNVYFEARKFKQFRVRKIILSLEIILECSLMSRRLVVLLFYIFTSFLTHDTK